MLRLVKKYTFGYHILSKTVALVPGKTIIMSSYPGALSSHDEFYLIQDRNHELIVAGTPLAVANNSLWNFMNTKDQVSETNLIFKMKIKFGLKFYYLFCFLPFCYKLLTASSY